MFKRLFALALLILVAPVTFSCNDGGGTLEVIRRDNLAYIATVPFEPPLMYQQGAELVGPDAELGRRIVAAIQETQQGGSEIKLTWINRTYPTLISALKNGEVHLALGALAITEERKREIQFSDPYYTSELVLFLNPVQKDLGPSELAGARVGVREGTGVESFVRENYPGAEVVPFKTIDDAVLALRRAEIDCAVDDKLLTAYSLSTTPGASYMEFYPEPLGTLECAVAMRKGDKELLELVNGVISDLKQQGLFAQLIEEHSAGKVQEVASRREERLEKERQRLKPRSVYISVSKDSSFDFDIYRIANLQFVFREKSTGETYRTTRIDFPRGAVGRASATAPPGNYTLSLPKFNFSTSVQITEVDPDSVSIRINLTSGGVVVRKG